MSALVQALDFAAFIAVCARLILAPNPLKILERLFNFCIAAVRRETLWIVAFFLLLVTVPGLFVFVGVALAERNAAPEQEEDPDAE